MICCDNSKDNSDNKPNRFGENKMSTGAIRIDLDNFGCQSVANGYVDHYQGGATLILCAPHGGRLKPGTIPDRDAGAYVNGDVVYGHSTSLKKDYDNLKVRKIADSNTIQLTLMLANELNLLIGKWPHVIINQLYRAKMDANCSVEKATFRVPEAEEAWNAFHDCIEQAKSTIQGGRGLFLDIHGQSHQEGWIELGYTVSGERINSGDFNISSTSIAGLAQHRLMSDHSLINGEQSLGGFLEQEGYETVPSPKYPQPGSGRYYTGGYNTIRHGSKQGGNIDAIQIECPALLREKHNLEKFSKSLARAIYKFWRTHYAES